MSGVERWRRVRAADGAAPRRVRRLASLPSSRAVVGGLLIATTAVLLFSAYRTSSTEPTQKWLIAARDMAAGSTIEASDLALAPMDLHPHTEDRAFAAADEVVGRVAASTMRPGDLVQSSDVVDETHLDNPSRRVGLELDLADALNGDLTVGDRLEVMASTGDGTDAAVVTVATVTTIADEDAAGVGSSARIRLTLSVPDIDAARAVVAARDSGTLTLLGAGPPTPGDEG